MVSVRVLILRPSRIGDDGRGYLPSGIGHPHLVIQDRKSGSENTRRELPRHSKNYRFPTLTEGLPSKRTRSKEVSPGRRSQLIALFLSFGRALPATWRAHLDGGGELRGTLPERHKSVNTSIRSTPRNNHHPHSFRRGYTMGQPTNNTIRISRLTSI